MEPLKTTSLGNARFLSNQYSANQCGMLGLQLDNQTAITKNIEISNVNQNNNTIFINTNNTSYGTGSLSIDSSQVDNEIEESLINSMGNIEGKLLKHNGCNVNETQVHKIIRKRKRGPKPELCAKRLSQNYDNVSSSTDQPESGQTGEFSSAGIQQITMSSDLETAINQLRSYDPNIPTTMQSETQSPLAGLNLEESLLADELLTSEALSDIATVISSLQYKHNSTLSPMEHNSSDVGCGLHKKGNQKERSKSLPSLFKEIYFEQIPAHKSNSLSSINSICSKFKESFEETNQLVLKNVSGDFKAKEASEYSNPATKSCLFEQIARDILTDVVDKVCEILKPKEKHRIPNDLKCNGIPNCIMEDEKTSEKEELLTFDDSFSKELSFRGRSLSLCSKPLETKNKFDKNETIKKFKGKTLYNWLLSRCEYNSMSVNAICGNLRKHDLLVCDDGEMQSTDFQLSSLYTWNSMTTACLSSSYGDDVMVDYKRHRRTSLPANIVKTRLHSNLMSSKSSSKSRQKMTPAPPITMTTSSGAIQTSFETNFEAPSKRSILETNLDHIEFIQNPKTATVEIANNTSNLPHENTTETIPNTILSSQSSTTIQSSISTQNTVLPNLTNQSTSSYNKTIILVNVGTQTIDESEVQSKSSNDITKYGSIPPPPSTVTIPQPPNFGTIPPPPSTGTIPPPPSTGTIPPPPGMGIIPPPPSTGTIPPPPGMGIIPPPPSTGTIPPPPGMGTIPPPPSTGTIPPPPGMGTIPPPPSTGTIPPPPGMGIIPPPPSTGTIPPPPGMGTIPPPPSTVPKLPSKPMKSLYWRRLNSKDVPPKKTTWSNMIDVDVNESEVEQFFCKVTVRRKKHVPTVKKASVKIKYVKLLETKRSQMVAIFRSSLSVSLTEIISAVVNVDTSLVDIETIKGIYEQRPQAGELEVIRNHMKKEVDLPDDKKQPLDRAEEFLWELWGIPGFSDRLFCVIFLDHFNHEVAEVRKTIATVDDVCQELKSEAVTRLLGIILSVGNYLNRGNSARGGATGFGLEILGKLKDVKANRRNETLLSYVILTYMRAAAENGDVSQVTYPIPATLEVWRAANVCYGDLLKERKRIAVKLKDCSRRVEMVLSKTEENQCEPFKTKLENFLRTASVEILELETKIKESEESFRDTVEYFACKCFKPKEFFELWFSFVADFGELWQSTINKEIAKKRKEEEVKLKSVARTRPRSRLKQRLVGNQ